MAMFRCNGIDSGDTQSGGGALKLRMGSMFTSGDLDQHTSVMNVYMKKGKKKITIYHTNDASRLGRYTNPKINLLGTNIKFDQYNGDYMNGDHLFTSFTTKTGYFEATSDEANLQFRLIATPNTGYLSTDNAQIFCMIEIEDV